MKTAEKLLKRLAGNIEEIGGLEHAVRDDWDTLKKMLEDGLITKEGLAALPAWEDYISSLHCVINFQVEAL